MLKLSLKRTMELHKELWEYIKSKGEEVVDLSNNFELETDDPDIDYNMDEIDALKDEFIFNKDIHETIKNRCFLCEYAANVRSYYFEKTGNSSVGLCTFCPVTWGTEDACDDYFCECIDEPYLAWYNGDFDRMINLKVKPELEYLLD